MSFTRVFIWVWHKALYHLPYYVIHWNLVTSGSTLHIKLYWHSNNTHLCSFYYLHKINCHINASQWKWHNEYVIVILTKTNDIGVGWAHYVSKVVADWCCFSICISWDIVDVLVFQCLLYKCISSCKIVHRQTLHKENQIKSNSFTASYEAINGDTYKNLNPSFYIFRQELLRQWWLYKCQLAPTRSHYQSTYP